MARKMSPDHFLPEDRLEDALVLDDMTATYAAAFAQMCANLGSGDAEPGDPYIALRLAQQMKQAAVAFWAGEKMDESVWLPEDAQEH